MFENTLDLCADRGPLACLSAGTDSTSQPRPEPFPAQDSGLRRARLRLRFVGETNGLTKRGTAFSFKKATGTSATPWTNLEDSTLSGKSQSQKDNYYKTPIYVRDPEESTLGRQAVKQGLPGAGGEGGGVTL